MNEKQLSWNYKLSMDAIRGTDEEKSKAAAVFDHDRSLVRKRGNNHRVPGIAATAIVLVCVLTFGGVTAWAMTGSFAFRDFFFKNSEKEFADVYTKAHKELAIGEHKIVYEGSIYDESVRQGSLNFSFWDAQGQPVEFNDNVKVLPANNECSEYTSHTVAYCIQIGSEEGYLFLNNINSASTFSSGNGLFVTFSMLDLDKPLFDQFEYKDFQFLLLGRDEYMNLKNEIAALDDDKLFSSEWDPVTQKMNFSIDYALAQSELANVLCKYDPQSIESIEFPSQVIQVESLKLTVGRMNMVMEYNENERTIDSFTLVREDGTRIGFRLDDRYIDSANNPTKIRLHWIVDGVDENSFSDGAGNLNGDLKLSYNFGFILGNNEKVTIEANGKIYQ